MIFRAKHNHHEIRHPMIEVKIAKRKLSGCKVARSCDCECGYEYNIKAGQSVDGVRLNRPGFERPEFQHRSRDKIPAQHEEDHHTLMTEGAERIQYSNRGTLMLQLRKVDEEDVSQMIRCNGQGGEPAYQIQIGRCSLRERWATRDFHLFSLFVQFVG